MSKNFITRLRKYYENIGSVMRGEAIAADVFVNPTDIGGARENIYIDFLKENSPSKCNVFLGGYLFDDDGNESKQIDVIVTTDTSPQFKKLDTDGTGKSFSPVEGTLGIAEIKSRLTKEELLKALTGIATIPLNKSLEGRILPNVVVPDYQDWPYKIIYATDSIDPTTIVDHINAYYSKNSHIPDHRRPNIIHVSGMYTIVRFTSNLLVSDQAPEIGDFVLTLKDPDIQGIVSVVRELQERASASNFIIYSYKELLNNVILAD